MRLSPASSNYGLLIYRVRPVAIHDDQDECYVAALLIYRVHERHCHGDALRHEKNVTKKPAKIVKVFLLFLF